MADVTRLRDEVGFQPRCRWPTGWRNGRLVAGAGPGMTLSVDVAIVAYRRWDLTESCLAHLAAPDARASGLPARQRLRRGHRRARASGVPGGRGAATRAQHAYPVACNRAVAAGSGDVVVTMNNDVDARPDFLERLVAPLEADRGVGSVAALLLRPGEDTVDSAGFVADSTLAPFPRWQGHHPLAGCVATARR